MTTEHDASERRAPPCAPITEHDARARQPQRQVPERLLQSLRERAARVQEQDRAKRRAAARLRAQRVRARRKAEAAALAAPATPAGDQQ